jgi:hypothetical protein
MRRAECPDAVVRSSSCAQCAVGIAFVNSAVLRPVGRLGEEEFDGLAELPTVERMQEALLGILAFLIVFGSMALWFRRIQRVQIPRDRRGFVASWLFGAGLGIVALAGSPGWIAGSLAVLAVVSGLLFSILYFISPQRVAENVIRVGEELRDFTAIDEMGNGFALTSTSGRPVLLKFFRGHW